MPNEKPKILLVEDDKGAQVAVSLILTHKFKCEVLVASTGEEAVQMAGKRLYDLIFMNIDLPGIDGIEATTQIKQLGKVNCKTPIVAFTGYSGDYIKQKCIETGMSGFLAKPLNNEEIKKVLAKFKTIS